jgi:cardiolipin synthase A/B
VLLSRVPRLGRRKLGLAAATTLLSRCAAVPIVRGVSGADAGLVTAQLSAPAKGQTTPMDDPPPPVEPTDPLQQQYDIQQALDATPLVTGNSVTLLPTANDAMRAIFQAIRSARSSVNMEYYILADVVVDGVSLSALLTDRLRAGVTINLIYDSFGSQDTPKAVFRQLQAEGAKVVEFNPLDPFAARTGWSPNDRDHRKLTVVDGRIGFTGGANIDKAYENPPSAGVPSDGDTRDAFWRDVAVRIEGPAVAELQKLFFATWTAQKGPKVDQTRYFPALHRTGVQTIRIIGSTPAERRPLYYASLLAAVGSARHRVWLCSGYFVPPHQEREDLANAARAGRDVRIVTPAHSDVEAAVYAARASYGDLLEAGAQIFEIHDAVLHAKLAVVDDTWSIVGSSNLDRRSVVFNQEVDAVILGHDAAAQVEAVLRGYMEDAKPVTLAAWQRRSLDEHVREIRARIWQYWM